MFSNIFRPFLQSVGIYSVYRRVQIRRFHRILLYSYASRVFARRAAATDWGLKAAARKEPVISTDCNQYSLLTYYTPRSPLISGAIHSLFFFSLANVQFAFRAIGKFVLIHSLSAHKLSLITQPYSLQYYARYKNNIQSC